MIKHWWDKDILWIQIDDNMAFPLEQEDAILLFDLLAMLLENWNAKG